MVRINLVCEEIGGRTVRIRELLRREELGRELVLYASMFLGLTTVACAFWLVQAWT